LVWVGWEGHAVAWRFAAQDPRDASSLVIAGNATPEHDTAWANAVLGIERQPPRFSDPAIAALQARYHGLRPFAAGNLFEGLVSAIVGQSISVAAAAVTERRLAALFNEGIYLAGRVFYPLPRPDQLAEASPERIRESGVTTRRAVALTAAARAWCEGRLPSTTGALQEPVRARDHLRTLPLVGPWTAESALLWGVGWSDAFPDGDAALLRAARFAFDLPALTHHDLRTIAARWAPARAWAARYLWTHLLGHPRNQ
jgi:3-methyladenine DNA glycosylase/8-oxoguanine DNA glycosylase